MCCFVNSVNMLSIGNVYVIHALVVSCFCEEGNYFAAHFLKCFLQNKINENAGNKKKKKSDLPGPYTNSWPFLRQARTSGKFSNEELSNLKREFQHHKDKIHEYNILMDTVSRTEGEPRSSGLDCGTEVNEPVLSSFRLHTRQDCFV